MRVRRPFNREQRSTVIYGMLAFVLILVVLQLWLLMATMNAYLGGDESVIGPAAIASGLCLLLGTDMPPTNLIVLKATRSPGRC
jgi:hypothetical protein